VLRYVDEGMDLRSRAGMTPHCYGAFAVAIGALNGETF
jgi:hypothetical protein